MEVTLQEMLIARDRRRERQLALLGRYGRPLICFTMNIPGPEKNSELILRAFRLGKRLLEGRLREQHIPLLHREEENGKTGNEAFYAADGDALRIKRLTAEIEEAGALGRLFDMDVLEGPDRKVERGRIGLPERRCLICGAPAPDCAARRVHPLPLLVQRTQEILREGLNQEKERTIERLAAKSLLFEVCATPKPGLVDREDNGSHRDMDMFTFFSGISAITPYFGHCARLGIQNASLPPQEVFPLLRQAGRQAEHVMLSSTGGINTHKGAIFSLGILCGALGRLGEEDWRNPEAVLAQCASIAAGIVERDLCSLDKEQAGTAGQKLYLAYGITGVRGQAQAGFPAVKNAGLPALEKALNQGCSLDLAGCCALLALIASSTDTNMIARSSKESQEELSRQAGRLVKNGRVPSREELRELNRQFIACNVSPGGSADLLAMTYFLHFLREEREETYLD